MTRRGGNILVVFVLAFIAWPGAATSAQSLDSRAQAAIATFGKGVIVSTSKDAKIDNAQDYLGFGSGTKQYKIVDGNNQGETVSRTAQAVSGSKDSYAVALGKFFTATAEVTKDGVFVTTEIEPSTSSLSTFSPSEIVLLNGLEVGKTEERTVSVKVHDVTQPTVVTHTGSLKCVYEVLGAFKVTTPAGVFDTIGVRVRYNGSVGPASVDDSNYIFFAKGFGPVAMRYRSAISAFLIYNKDDKRSLLLSKK